MRPPYRKPDDLLFELGIEAPSEIDVEAIASYCGATVAYQALVGCEARLLGTPDRAIVTVNADSGRPRQRFSIAHELGHWLTDRGRISFGCTKGDFVGGWGQSSSERRANRFAADLLLPAAFFEPRARQRAVSFSTASELASEFEASLTATAIRLVELGSFPSMILYTEGGKRRWFIRSRDLPPDLWPLEAPGDGSLSAGILRESDVSAATGEVESSEWLDRTDTERVPVVEDSRRVGAGVLTLLWWRDESALLAVLDDEDAP